jgi:hypothetical protein
VLRPYRASGRLIAFVLAAAWIWNGIAYHMLQFATLVWAAWGFGALFVLQGLLFLMAGLRRGGLDFRFRPGLRGWAGLLLALFAIAAYPLIAMLTGPGWPRSAPFGLAPDPTAIFTLGMLLLAEPRTPLRLLVIPLLWAIAGGSLAWVLGLPLGLALPIAAVLALVLALGTRRVSRARAA